MANAADIAGYTYKVENYSPAQLIEVLIAEGVASPGARGMAVEDVLDQIAGANAIDRYDERTFDSSEFPKVIFVSQLSEDDRRTWYDV
ncbi:MAG: hypothetical protein WAX14_08365 [Rhodococcus sp. (in: high G+C Gram-positive bacteria)]|uniref:hypothetical protein n=1 Tax=Rhodococcus sp. TaxID=1831 RepID=UPI003BB667CF